MCFYPFGCNYIVRLAPDETIEKPRRERLSDNQPEVNRLIGNQDEWANMAGIRKPWVLFCRSCWRTGFNLARESEIGKQLLVELTRWAEVFVG
jgi:hypothetical protein